MIKLINGNTEIFGIRNLIRKSEVLKNWFKFEF